MHAKFALLSLAATSALAAPSFSSQYEMDGGNRNRDSGSILEKLRDDKRFTKFVQVLEKERNLADDLEKKGTHTLFAPTNEAIKRFEDKWRSSTDNRGGKPEMRDILRYHLASDAEITEDCMHAGAIIPTSLRVRTLDDRHQRVRVFDFAGRKWLNMRAQIVDSDIKAENGIIHAVDNVLVPPSTVTEMINVVPTRLSTFALALERTGLACDVNRKKALTVFSPNNEAWMSLGPENLRYLFSCAGQETWTDKSSSSDKDRDMCQGIQDLKKIVSNHIGTELRYSTDLMRDEKTTIKTLGNRDITVCTKKRGGERQNRDEGGDKHKNVQHYNFVVNDGESRIKFTDLVASNGAVQVIDNVLVGDMRLPHDRLGQ